MSFSFYSLYEIVGKRKEIAIVVLSVAAVNDRFHLTDENLSGNCEKQTVISRTELHQSFSQNDVGFYDGIFFADALAFKLIV